jgi:hypothetical protein
MGKPTWPSHVEKLQVPIYGGKLAICRSRKDYKHCCESYGDDDDASGYAGCAQEYGNPPVYIVGVFSGGLPTLVHELAHVCFMILRRSGVTISQRSDEAYCHLLDALLVVARQPRAKRKPTID